MNRKYPGLVYMDHLFFLCYAIFAPSLNLGGIFNVKVYILVRPTEMTLSVSYPKNPAQNNSKHNRRKIIYFLKFQNFPLIFIEGR